MGFFQNLKEDYAAAIDELLGTDALLQEEDKKISKSSEETEFEDYASDDYESEDYESEQYESYEYEDDQSVRMEEPEEENINTDNDEDLNFQEIDIDELDLDSMEQRILDWNLLTPDENAPETDDFAEPEEPIETKEAFEPEEALEETKEVEPEEPEETEEIEPEEPETLEEPETVEPEALEETKDAEPEEPEEIEEHGAEEETEHERSAESREDIARFMGLLPEKSLGREETLASESIIKAAKEEVIQKTMMDEQEMIEKSIIEEQAEVAGNSNIAEPEETISDEVALITKGMKVVGNIKSNGNLDLEGTVVGNIKIAGKINIYGEINGDTVAGNVYADGAKIDGSITSTGSVKVARDTVIVGDIVSASAVVAGAVKGNIDVQGPVILDSTAIVMGNIKSQSVQITSGAVIEGMCSQCYAKVNPASFFDELEKNKED